MSARSGQRHLVVETPEGLALRHELAGAGARAAAGLVDLAWIAFALFVAYVGFTVFSFVDGGRLTGVLGALLLGGSLVFAVLLQTIVPSAWDGVTPGKHLLGLRVVDRNGWPARPRQHFLRAVFWLLEVLPIPIPGGLFAMALLPDHQRLGDLVAGTVVIRPPSARRSGTVAEPFARESWEGLQARALRLAPAHRERFSGRDLDFLRELFGRAGIASEARRALFVRAWEHYAAVLGFDAVRPSEDRSASSQAGAGGAVVVPEDAADHLRELYLFLRG